MVFTGDNVISIHDEGRLSARMPLLNFHHSNTNIKEEKYQLINPLVVGVFQYVSIVWGFVFLLLKGDLIVNDVI